MTDASSPSTRRWTRRRVLQTAASLAGGVATGASARWGRHPAGPPPRVVVIGGGPGGASCARHLRRYAPGIDVTLVEPQTRYHTCFGGNWYLAGLTDHRTLIHGYGALRQAGVRVVHQSARDWDPVRRHVVLADGQQLPFDRLVVAPGIAFRWDEVDGMDERDAARIPHAWAGGAHYRTLRRQLRAMPDDGVFAIVTPPAPFRCPPGPYERTSLVAHYLEQHKPRARVLLLDAEFGFSKQGLFEAGWRARYGDRIQRLPGTQGGRLDRVDARTRRVWTEHGSEPFKPDVLNLIPPQKAAALAEAFDLVDETGWCPTVAPTMASTRYPDVHVLGDAARAGPMPKSAHSANSQARGVAATLAAVLNGDEPARPGFVNTCYSLIAPDYGISIAGIYEARDGALTEVHGGVSPDGDPGFRAREAAYTRGWYRSITADIFGPIPPGSGTR